MEASTRTEASEVLTMDDYGAIRRARRGGKSIRQIAREFNLSRITDRFVFLLNSSSCPFGRGITSYAECDYPSLS